MHSGLKLITGPSLEPLTQAQAENFLKVESGSDDADLITALIIAARRSVESYTGRIMISQAWEYWLDRFPCSPAANQWWDGVREGPLSLIMESARSVQLPIGPLISLTQLSTFDIDDVETNFDSDNLVVDTISVPPRIALKNGQIWPVNLRAFNSVRVQFAAGYGTTAASVPGDLVHAVRLLISHFYEHRELIEADQSSSTLPMPWSVQQLLEPYKVLRII